MKHWVGYRAEIKNEIAALEKFGKENEMRPFHLWNRWYPNLATPHFLCAVRHEKNVYGFLHTRSSDGHQAVIFNAAGRAALDRLTASRIRRPARAYARVNQLCLFSASRPFTTTPASASFFSRLPVIIGVATSRPISAAWL